MRERRQDERSLPPRCERARPRLGATAFVLAPARHRTIARATFHTRGSGGLSVAAGRREQPRGRPAVALLSLSDFSSATVAVEASTSSLLWLTSDRPSGGGGRLDLPRFA